MPFIDYFEYLLYGIPSIYFSKTMCNQNPGEKYDECAIS